MNKRIWFGILVCSLLLVQATMAQDSTKVVGWKKSLGFDLTTAQTAYSDSWVGGEAGSFNWVSNLNGNAERQLSPKVNYSTILKLSFGQTYTQDEETKEWSKAKKSTDLIDWDNMFRFTFGGFVDPYAAFRVESQFFTLHSSPTLYKRVFFRPTKFTESAGIAKRLYTGKETENITSRLGLAVREVLNTELVKDSANGDSFLNSTYNDGGFESVTDFNLMLAKQIGYVGKLTLYKAIFFSDKDKVKGSAFEDDWKAIDVNFENQFNVQMTKLVVVKLYTQVLYDKQVSKKGRFKETLGLGLAYKVW